MTKISVIILNYIRPHNLKYSIPLLINYNFIDEIIILNGNLEKSFYFDHPKVRIYEDIDNNIYGGARRFLKISEINNDFVLFLDDDILPSEQLINTSVNILNYYNDQNFLLGLPDNCRYISSDGYSFRWTKNSRPNFTTTQYLLTKKTIIEDFLKHEEGFEKYKEWYKKYKGNCEDISLNIFCNKYYDLPKYSLGNYKLLDESNGYSSNENHYVLRSSFCKRFINDSTSKSIFN